MAAIEPVDEGRRCCVAISPCRMLQRSDAPDPAAHDPPHFKPDNRHATPSVIGGAVSLAIDGLPRHCSPSHFKPGDFG